MHDYFKHLITFDTTSEAGLGTKDCLDWLEEFFSDRFLYTHRVEHSDFESIIATTKPTKTPKILLQAHLDVVPAPGELFKLKEKDGKYFGRGVFDMKFAIALYMQLVESLKDCLSDYDFGIMITTDEEVGGENGVKALIDDGFSCEVCIIPDGGDNWCLEGSSKGFYLVEATAKGKTAHGSRPWEGENAIEKILQFIETVRSVFSETDSHENTITVSTIRGGAALNQVPEEASTQLDIRTKDQDSHRSVASAIKKAAELHNVEIDMKLQGVPFAADLENEYVKSFLEITEAIRSTVVKPCVSLGSSDARFFAEKNIPTIVMRPHGGGAHSDGEWIKKDDLNTYYKILDEFIKSNA